MAQELQFRLVDPEAERFHGAVVEVQIPTSDGPISVLANHMPLVVPIAAGVLEIRQGTSTVDHYAVSGGMLTVTKEGAVAVTDAAEHAESIDELLVRQAIEEGRKALETHLTEAQITAANATVQRNLVRLEASQRRQRHHRSRTPQA